MVGRKLWGVNGLFHWRIYNMLVGYSIIYTVEGKGNLKIAT